MTTRGSNSVLARREHGASVVALLVLLAVACGQSVREVHLNFPLSVGEVRGTEAFVELAEGVDVDSLLPADLFGEFQPGITAQEARVLFGSPDDTVQDSARRRDTDTVYRYRRQEATVEVIRSVAQSEGLTRVRWLIRACPFDTSPEAHLHRSIVNLIETEEELESIVFLRRSRTPLFSVEVSSGRIGCIYRYPDDKA